MRKYFYGGKYNGFVKIRFIGENNIVRFNLTPIFTEGRKSLNKYIIIITIRWVES